MRQRVTSGIAVVLCVLLFAACGSGAATTVSKKPAPLPSAGTITATIPGMGPNGDYEYDIAGDDTAVWVHNATTGYLIRIDPTTNKQVALISVGEGRGGMALGQGSVWIVNARLGTVSRIDPQTNTMAATITIGPPSDAPKWITVSPGAVWVGDFTNDALIRVDPQSRQVVATIPNQLGIFGLSYGAGSVWACNHHSFDQGLVRVDPQTNQVLAQINPNVMMTQTSSPSNLGACGNVRALAQSVWTTSYVNDDPASCLLERIDPATNTVKATIPMPGIFPHDMAADEHGVWLFNPSAGLYRVDSTTNRLAGLLKPPDRDLQEGMAVVAGSLWVVQVDGMLLRITPAA